MILSINMSNSNKVNKFSVDIFARKGHINQAYLTAVSESVSQWVSDKHSQWSDSGPIKIIFLILFLFCAQSLNKSLALGPNVSSQICNKLLPTWSSALTSATVTTLTSFELASSHARVTSIKFTKQEWVSQWVSYKGKQWSDPGPIKNDMKSKVQCPHSISRAYLAQEFI